MANAAKRDFHVASPIASTVELTSSDSDGEADSEDQADDEPEVHHGAPVLAGLTIPDPVFFCSVEPPSMAYQKPLEHALECLTKEDPSLRVQLDPDTGETVIAGMGELHLDIIKDRILKEFGVDVHLGTLQIAYKEMLDTSAEKTVDLDTTIGETRHKVTICLSVHPVSDGQERPLLSVEPHENSALAEKRTIYRPRYKAIENGIKSAFSRGKSAD